MSLTHGNMVFVLFHARIRLVERVIIYWLKRRGIIVEFVYFNSKRSWREAGELGDRLAKDFINKYEANALGGEYFIHRLGRLFFSQVNRITSIIQFVRNEEKLSEIRKIYISRVPISSIVCK